MATDKSTDDRIVRVENGGESEASNENDTITGQGQDVEDVQVEVKTHPDGGWGWVVCLGAFFIQFLMLGVQNSAGIFYTTLVDRFKAHRGVTAWVGSLATGMMFFLGPLTTSLCERFGCRVVALAGAALCTMGLVLSSFVTSLPVLYFTYGIIWGAGTSLCYFPTIIVLSKYFFFRLSLVNGLVTAGSGVGTLCMGPIVQLLFSHLGYEHAFQTLAAVLLPVFVCGALFRPVHPEATREQSDPTRNRMTKLFYWEIFKNKGYVVWMICLATFMLGYFVPFVHLVRHAEDMGIHPTKASFLIGYMSIASTLGRLVFGKIADSPCVNRLYIYQFGFLVMAMCSIFVTMVKDYAGLVAYSVMFGFFEGCYVVLIPVITSDIVGTEKMSYALGSMFTVMAFPMMLGPPIAGWLYDLTGDYSLAFYLCGATSFLPACLMYFIPCLTKPPKSTPLTSQTPTPRAGIIHREDESGAANKQLRSSGFLSSYFGSRLLREEGRVFEAPSYEILRVLDRAKI